MKIEIDIDVDLGYFCIRYGKENVRGTLGPPLAALSEAARIYRAYMHAHSILAVKLVRNNLAAEGIIKSEFLKDDEK